MREITRNISRILHVFTPALPHSRTPAFYTYPFYYAKMQPAVVYTKMRPVKWMNQSKWLLTRAVTVLKPKPKTAGLRRNRTATEPRFSGGHVTVFLEFQKWPSPVTNVPKQQPNYLLSRLPPAPFEVTEWASGVELPDSLITRRDKSTFVLLSVPSGLTRTYRWTPSHASQISEWRGKLDWLTHMLLWEIVMITIHCNWRRKNT